MKDKSEKNQITFLSINEDIETGNYIFENANKKYFNTKDDASFSKDTLNFIVEQLKKELGENNISSSFENDKFVILCNKDLCRDAADVMAYLLVLMGKTKPKHEKMGKTNLLEEIER